MSVYSLSRWSGALMVLVFGILTACSPALNWREVVNNDFQFVATFPDKPVQVTRTLDMAGFNVPLTLQAATAKNIYFAVGVVELKGPLAGQGEALKGALIQALANNVKVSEVQSQMKPWAGLERVDWVELAGQLPDGKPGRAVGRFFIVNNQLIEVLLVGPTDQVDTGTEKQWLTGFRLLGL